MKAWFAKAFKGVAYLIAIFIIISALFVSISQLLSPALDKHRGDFEKWATQLLGMPVTIDKVRVSWYRYQPEISLNQVTILNQTGKDPILQIESIRVFFSIPKSVWEWKFIPSGIMVSGSDVNIHEVAKGEFSVQGFPSFGGFKNQPYQKESKFADVMNWLSTQPQLILHDINVTYTGFNKQKRFVTLYDLSLTNLGNQHTILGKAILQQDVPTEVTVSIQWLGDGLDLAKIRAKIYLYVSGFSMSQWFKEVTWNHWQMNKGMGSAKIWLTWDRGTFKKIQSTFQLYDIELYSFTNKSKHVFNRLSGNIGWRLEGQSQTFAGEDILIDLPTHLWPVTNFYISLVPDANNVLVPRAVNIGYVDLHDVQTFLFALQPALSDTTKKMLATLQLKGALQNVVMTFSGPWTDWKSISLNANFNQISFLPIQKYPGMNRLSGMFKWNGNQGHVTLQSNHFEFAYPSVFNNVLQFEQLSSDVDFQQDTNQDWQFKFQSTQFLNNDMAANLNGTLNLSNKSAPQIDLTGNFTLQKANHITRYLPLKIFAPKLVKWLQAAFLAGEVQSGKAVLHGALTDFPFDKGNGTFLISGAVKNVDFVYAPDWPQLSHANGRIVFSGRRMDVDLDNAKILGVTIQKAHGEIPNFSDAAPQVLTVRANDIAMDFAEGLKFIHASPLQKTIGKIFSNMKVTGPIQLQLGLIVPLGDPDKTQVQGDIALTQAMVNLVPWQLKLNNLNGQLQFTENSITAEKIGGQLFNKPLVLGFKTVQKNHSSIIQANIKNNLSVADLETWLKVPFSQVAQGAADVTGDIDFSLQAPIEIHLHSNLQGITLDLPDEYGKKATDSANFNADILVQENQPLRMKLTYNNLGAALILDRKNEAFGLIGANIQLGAGTPAWPEGAGLYITANFNKLTWDQIERYTSSSNQSGQSHHATGYAGLMLHKIDVNAKTLDLAGQKITGAHIAVRPNQDHWDVNVMSNEIAGTVQVPTHITPQGLISAQFQKFNLRASSLGSKQKAPTIKVKTLPSISFTANNVSYNEMPLGQVSFKTVPSANGIAIQTLRITSPRMDFQATGEWTAANVTRLQGAIKSNNVSGLVNSFGLDAHNLISSYGRFDFKLSWNAPPFAPSLAGLNGTANLDLGKGRIVDIGASNNAKMDLGRMLSIFSLQTIPRRLSFDFSDVFQKGYSFDYVRGNFSFRNGSAYTNDLRFDGPIARIGIDGRIGLKNKDYDFILSITPYNVTSSLPVAATLLSAGNPVVGLAAFAVNTVISPAVSKAVTYHYKVRGPWNNPSWQSVGGGK